MFQIETVPVVRSFPSTQPEVRNPGRHGELAPAPAGAADLHAWAAAELEAFGPCLREIELALEAQDRVLWSTMVPTGRPCFTMKLIEDYLALYARMRRLFAEAPGGGAPVKYLVYRSGVPGVFSLGGDLALFSALIRRGDREGLRRYAHACARMTYENAMSAGLPVVTIALIQGQALGGGLESALSCNVLVAERSAQFGLPEILFNLFPGMGAYSYLARRIGAAATEKLILDGGPWSAAELHALGVVDVVAEDGQGEAAVRDYIARNARRHNAQCAIFRTRRRVSPLTFEELRDVTDIWVDCAMGIDRLDLRKMEKLVSAQDRLQARIQSPAIPQ